jgi:hypothetical protein
VHCNIDHSNLLRFRERSVKFHSAAARCARASSSRASSLTGAIGAKSRCAIHSARVNLVMWLEQAQSVT